MKFRNKITGCIEEVNNQKLIEQYEKYTDVYEKVDGSNKKAATKKSKKAK